MGLIYGLIDGDTMELRYVGQTMQSHERRLKKHHVSNNRHLRHWLRSVNPNVIVLERDSEDLDEAEIRWIREMREQGARLLNIEDGGKNSSCSLETRMKLRILNLGKRYGFRSEETRAKISAMNRKRVLSDETRAKIGVANRGRTHSAEARVKMSIAHKDKPLSLKHRTAIGLSLRGREVSEGTRAKMSAIRKGWWASLSNEARSSFVRRLHVDRPNELLDEMVAQHTRRAKGGYE